jgi:hypothetical protein
MPSHVLGGFVFFGNFLEERARDRCHQGARRNGYNPGYLEEALGGIALPAHDNELGIQIGDPLIRNAPFFPQILQQGPAYSSKFH